MTVATAQFSFRKHLQHLVLYNKRSAQAFDYAVEMSLISEQIVLLDRPVGVRWPAVQLLACHAWSRWYWQRCPHLYMSAAVASATASNTQVTSPRETQHLTSTIT